MECPVCKEKTLNKNKDWDKAYDRLDANYPSLNLIYSELEREGIPHYNCSNCNYEKYE